MIIVEAIDTRYLYSLQDGRDAMSDEESDDAHSDNATPEPIVIAESQGEVRTLTVGMASLELDAADSPFLMFKNAANGGLNIVYRRPDGHIGWVDPAHRGGEGQGIGENSSCLYEKNVSGLIVRVVRLRRIVQYRVRRI